jgi:flagellar protein FlaJ
MKLHKNKPEKSMQDEVKPDTTQKTGLIKRMKLHKNKPEEPKQDKVKPDTTQKTGLIKRMKLHKNKPEEPMQDKDKPDTTQKTGLIKRLSMTGQINRLFVYLAATIPAIICIFFALLGFIGAINPLVMPVEGGTLKIGTPVDFLVIAVIIFTGIYGIFEFLRLRKVRKIDERFPDFVRDLAESRRAGMTFTKAIMYSSRGNYGPLTPEIQKIANQISWGSSVDNALRAFAKRVNTKLIDRTISLIIEASRSGGNVADVLDAASKDARELKLMEGERRAGMLSYVAVIYVSMGVFLLIMVVLCKSLIPAMTGQGSEGLASAMGKGSGITRDDISQLFFYATIFQSAGMGAVTGVFEDGKVVSGVKHMFIMILITWFIFKLVVMGI